MKQKKWVIADRLDPALEQHLLLSRLQQTNSSAEQYLHPSLSDLSAPASFTGMQPAVERIIQAINNHESIVVWGDFDADGVTSTAIMWETLHQLGAMVMPYIPNRDTEGHGFSPEGVKKLLDDQIGLVVTVDHGITAIDEVEALSNQGIEVVVTDHHEPRLAKSEQKTKDKRQKTEFELPDAVAVVHPLLMDSPQPLAGCGVAYMLAYAVWLAHRFQEFSKSDVLETRQEFAQGKIELAAIGAIADMVPLLGDNRVLATYGLKSLVKTSRPGLQQMYRLAGMEDKQQFGAYEIGFGIGPRLNAPGRLGDALQSLRLLCTKNLHRATQLAQDLDSLNQKRQELLAQVAEEAKTEVLKHTDGVYVLTKPNWPAGVCGLAAGKIVESLYRPTVVMECMGELSRGSARSIRGFDFTAALTSIADLLETYGGHAMAAGFVAKTENLPLIEERLSELLWQQFDKDSLHPQLMIDAEVKLDELSWDLHAFICQLEPFGMGNPKPVFISRNLEVINHRLVGSDGKHLKLTLAQGEREKGEGESGQTLNPFNGIAFNLGYLAEQLKPEIKVDVAYQLDENIWQNRRSLQLMIKDIRIVKMKNDPLG